VNKEFKPSAILHHPVNQPASLKLRKNNSLRLLWQEPKPMVLQVNSGLANGWPG